MAQGSRPSLALLAPGVTAPLHPGWGGGEEATSPPAQNPTSHSELPFLPETLPVSGFWAGTPVEIGLWAWASCPLPCWLPLSCGRIMLPPC